MGVSGQVSSGNSIFAFAAARLCIGHLGQLHHAPSEAQYAVPGRLGVVMAAVNGSMTLDLPTMIGVPKRLRSSIASPMHWFEGWTLQAFVAGMADDFTVVDGGAVSISVSLRSLPSCPANYVLRPCFLRDAG